MCEKKIHILENGKIAFSKEAVSDLYPHHCIDLYYDADEKKIKLEPLDDYGFDNSFKLKGLLNLFIAAKDFFEHFEIPIPVGEYEYILDQGMLIVQLGGEE
jgi:hypothetical protein